MNWTKLLALLDAMFGFTNRTRSTVKVYNQAFDNKTQEHIVWLEYRAHVRTTIPPKPRPKQVPKPAAAKAQKRKPMQSIREMFERKRQGRSV